MQRRDALVLLLAALSGCVPSAQRQAVALMPIHAVTDARVRQSRRFDTPDEFMMLQATVGALQDLGFTIDETQAQYGIIVGSKLGGGRIRVQVVLLPAVDHAAIIVRATFQRIVSRPGAMLAIGEVLDEPELYQGFFEKLAQSAFLTAHEI